jgi:hypothetical protein
LFARNFWKTVRDFPHDGTFAGVVGIAISRDGKLMAGGGYDKDKGNYFLKLYGPKATIDENEKGFQEMIKSLKVK